MSRERLHISGYALKSDGWEKDGFKWWKGWSELVYDGCDWLYMYAVECIVKEENAGIKVIWRRVEYMDEIKKF